MTPNASALYDAGTAALARGDLGEAVLRLAAASRLEPRAADIARNRAIAEARVALSRGDEGRPPVSEMRLALSSGEAWLLAALLVAAGAAGMAWSGHRADPLAARRAPETGFRRAARRGLHIAGVAGFLLTLALATVAFMETLSPEAVVLDRSLPLTAASGQSLPGSPELVAGERVRLGALREGLVEIRLGGTPLGWARLAGVWRVRDAARYTPASAPEQGENQEGSGG
jgi:hypothetical protein